MKTEIGFPGHPDYRLVRTIRLQDSASFFLQEGAGIVFLTAGAQGAMYREQQDGNRYSLF
ncbi:hypothetical protein [Microbulbifer variabilis]|uniref:hypothetical protein n=1 Tax=Microbulbifer variabilis TaxID=266805 RepID=UPI001CFD9897|nr:hypothetical protein [Microbulbifer variabilis]